MFELIYGHDEILLPWAAEKLHLPNGFQPDARAIGSTWNGVLNSVVVYDRFSEGDCCMHVCGHPNRKWLHKSYLYAGFAFPFLQLGLRRVTGLVPAFNAEALRFDQHLGFKFEGRLRQGMSHEQDLIVLGMLKSECKWIDPRFTKAIHRYATKAGIFWVNEKDAQKEKEHG